MKSSIRLIPCLWACALWLEADSSLASDPAAMQSLANTAHVADADALADTADRAREETSRQTADAYWQEVAERLLMGQRAAGSCPPAREVSSCLLAARILSVIDSRRKQVMESSLPQPERDRVRALLRSVAARSHENPMLLWAMTWDVFQREVPESRDRTIAELRRREPENLQVWLLSLGDESWTRERLSAAARSTRLDAYLYDFLRADLEHLAEITADAPVSDGLNFDPSPVESAQVLLTGMLFAETMPRLQGLIEFCAAPDAEIQGVARADCWQIAERLTGHAESVIDLALGSTLMRRSARDPLQRQRAEQARLDYEYLQEGFVEALRSGEQERLFMQRMREPGATEISAARLMLIDAGLPPELPRAH